MVDGANVAEAEQMVKDLEELNPMNSIKTKEDALAFMERNQIFKSALDSETSKRAEHAIDNFKEKKLPDLIKAEKDKLEKELNPDLTDEQKRIKELENRLSEADKEKQTNQAKAALRSKAEEIAKKAGVKYDPVHAERFHVYGDDAEKLLTDEINYFKSTIDSELSAKLKSNFTPGAPTIGEPSEGGFDERILAAKKAGNLSLVTKLLVEKQNENQG